MSTRTNLIGVSLDVVAVRPGFELVAPGSNIIGSTILERVFELALEHAGVERVMSWGDLNRADFVCAVSNQRLGVRILCDELSRLYLLSSATVGVWDRDEEIWRPWYPSTGIHFNPEERLATHREYLQMIASIGCDVAQKK